MWHSQCCGTGLGERWGRVFLTIGQWTTYSMYRGTVVLEILLLYPSAVVQYCTINNHTFYYAGIDSNM